MTKLTQITTCLMGCILLAGCSSAPVIKSSDQTHTQKLEMRVSHFTHTHKSEMRDLSYFEKRLTKTLTPALAVKAFGEPNGRTGSGLIIYIYILDDGRELWMGFPGYAPIAYAKVRSKDGSTQDLVLK